MCVVRGYHVRVHLAIALQYLLSRPPHRSLDSLQSSTSLLLSGIGSLGTHAVLTRSKKSIRPLSLLYAHIRHGREINTIEGNLPLHKLHQNHNLTTFRSQRINAARLLAALALGSYDATLVNVI